MGEVPGKSPLRLLKDVTSHHQSMSDHQRFLGPDGGIPPTKRAKLDETSGRPVGTKVDVGIIILKLG